MQTNNTESQTDPKSPIEADKVVLITGAGSGIGSACAHQLANEGYSVVLAGRRIDRLEQVQSTLNKPNLHLSHACDISDEAAVAELFSRIQQTYGRLDVLFNNAGTGARPQPIDELPVSEWLRVVNTNLTGSYLCAREAFKLMKQQLPQGGRIINNGSVSAQVPRPNSAPYTATKHGITGLTRSLSLDGRAFNIACGQIDIGNALTEMTGIMAKGVPQPDGSTRPEATMNVDDVAKALSYMAGLPLGANVQFMTVMATTMPMIGRG